MSLMFVFISVNIAWINKMDIIAGTDIPIANNMYCLGTTCIKHISIADKYPNPFNWFCSFTKCMEKFSYR